MVSIKLYSAVCWHRPKFSISILQNVAKNEIWGRNTSWVQNGFVYSDFSKTLSYSGIPTRTWVPIILPRNRRFLWHLIKFRSVESRFMTSQHITACPWPEDFHIKYISKCNLIKYTIYEIYNSHSIPIQEWSSSIKSEILFLTQLYMCKLYLFIYIYASGCRANVRYKL